MIPFTFELVKVNGISEACYTDEVVACVVDGVILPIVLGHVFQPSTNRLDAHPPPGLTAGGLFALLDSCLSAIL